MTKASPQKFVTKKTMARLEREQLQKRYIRLGAIIVITLVILIIGYGLLDQKVLKYNRSVATVDGQKITLRDFQTLHKFSRWRLVQEYQNTAQFASMFGNDQTFSQQFLSSMQQIQLQLSAENAGFLGADTLNQLTDDKLIEIEAAKLGISVSEDEVETALKQAFNFFPDGTPTPIPTKAILPTSTFSPKQMTLLPPTATATPESVTATVTPTLPVPTATATIDPALPTATLEPSPTPFTLEGYQGLVKNYVDELTKFGFSESDLRRIIHADLLRKKFLDEYTKDIELNQEHVWLRHVSTTDEQQAKDAVEQLRGGNSFNVVASAISQDPNTKDIGGDLGWLTRGEQDAAVEEVVFNLEIGAISEPIQTTNGWEVIQVLGKEIRPISDTRMDTLRNEKLATFLKTQKDSDRVKKFDTWQQDIPDEPTIPAEMLAN